MATYKVLQDIEAEDKLVGPLTLWQFIYALVAGLMIYLSAIAVMKHATFLLVFTTPVALFAAFLAVPWGGDQPTEVWAIAKLRFLLKPRRRIWDQSGMSELVTVTAPKKVEQQLTDGLDQHQVRSRLSALATTLDSRGWAIKNANISMATQRSSYDTSDRLVDVSRQTPVEVPTVDIRAEDDILDEQANPVAQNLDVMIEDATNKYRQALLSRMNQPTVPPTPAPAAVAPVSATPQAAVAPTWFTAQQANATLTPVSASQPAVSTQAPAQVAPVIPQAAKETAEDEALLARIKAQQQHEQASSHLKNIKTPEQLAEEAKVSAARMADQQREADAARAAKAAEEEAKKRAAEEVIAQKKAAIMNLARSNDLNIATIQRQAGKDQTGDGEVEIPLHY